MPEPITLPTTIATAMPGPSARNNETRSPELELSTSPPRLKRHSPQPNAADCHLAA